MVKNYDKFLCVKGNDFIEKGEVITIHNLSKYGDIAFSAGRMDKDGVEFCLNMVDDDTCVANFGNCKPKWNAYFVSVKSLLNDKLNQLIGCSDSIKHIAELIESQSDNQTVPKSQDYYHLLSITKEQQKIKCEITNLINIL